MDLVAGEISMAQERCTRPFAPTAKLSAKYRSSLPMAGPYTVRIASRSTGSQGSKTFIKSFRLATFKTEIKSDTKMVSSYTLFLLSFTGRPYSTSVGYMQWSPFKEP
jgi:hypothetical protein